MAYKYTDTPKEKTPYQCLAWYIEKTIKANKDLDKGLAVQGNFTVGLSNLEALAQLAEAHKQLIISLPGVSVQDNPHFEGYLELIDAQKELIEYIQQKKDQIEQKTSIKR